MKKDRQKSLNIKTYSTENGSEETYGILPRGGNLRKIILLQGGADP